MLPSFSERDAWSKLARLGDNLYCSPRGRTTRSADVVLQSSDPFFDAVTCRFDLREGVTHLVAEGTVPFWSASVYDRNGQNIYSFNDRTAAEGSLDFVIATPLQMTEVRKNLPPNFQKSVFVEADIDEGIVVVRSFVPDASWKPAITGLAERRVMQPPVIPMAPTLTDSAARLRPALRYGFRRSSFEKPDRWLFVAFGDHFSPPQAGRGALAAPATMKSSIGDRRNPQ